MSEFFLVECHNCGRVGCSNIKYKNKTERKNIKCCYYSYPVVVSPTPIINNEADIEARVSARCKEVYESYIKGDTKRESIYRARREEGRRLGEKICNEREQHRAEISNTNTPKCPTCNSTNIHKIDGLERGVSVVAWGLFSSKINKTFKCNNCGYTW